MVKVKLIEKIKDKNGYLKREVKSEKEIKKNKDYKTFISELSKAFSIPKNKIILMVLTEDEDEFPINGQEDLNSYIGETKEFMIIIDDSMKIKSSKKIKEKNSDSDKDDDKNDNDNDNDSNKDGDEKNEEEDEDEG